MYKPAFKNSEIFAERPALPEGDVSIPLTGTVQEILPSEKNYVGKSSRYFTMQRSDKTVMEVSRNTYQLLYTKSPEFDHLAYIIGELKWDTTFPIYDSMEGKYLLEGSNTKNLREVEKLEKTLPGIKDYLVLKGELFI